MHVLGNREGRFVGFPLDSSLGRLYSLAMKRWVPHFSLALALSQPPVVTGSGSAASAPAAPGPVESFVCTQVMGVSVTGDWFGAGFEDGIDGSRWQALWRSHAFVELWADPASDLWSMKPSSPCALRSDNPDRVIFTGVNWEYKSLEAWEEKLSAVVATIRKKYPGVRRIDLLTMLRAPGNHSCGSEMTVVEPYVDDAVAAVAARFPGLVFAGPKVMAESCEVFTKGGPHFTDAGMAVVARLYRGRLLAH
jgi:hypothetical protein